MTAGQAALSVVYILGLIGWSKHEVSATSVIVTAMIALALFFQFWLRGDKC